MVQIAYSDDPAGTIRSVSVSKGYMNLAQVREPSAAPAAPRKLQFPAVALCAFILAAMPMTALASASPADLEDHSWLMSPASWNEPQQWPTYGAIPKPAPYIGFAGGTISGSTGCGRLTGTYHRSESRLTVAPVWSDDQERPCDEADRRDASRILGSLQEVRSINMEPEYSHEDVLLLQDANGETKVRLGPFRPGNDLSELHDTFWRVVSLQGADPVPEAAIVNIGERSIEISTPSCFSSFPYGFKLSGLQFFPAFQRSTHTENSRFERDRRVTESFEALLGRIKTYRSKDNTLTFFDGGGQALMVLRAIHSTGIENQRWRIAKYRAVSYPPTGGAGLIEARERADITFLNGDIEGSSGCGGWVGSYTITGIVIAIRADAVLAGMCSGSGFNQGWLVKEAINGEMKIENDGGRVLLTNSSGQAQVLLVPYWGHP